MAIGGGAVTSARRVKTRAASAFGSITRLILSSHAAARMAVTMPSVEHVQDLGTVGKDQLGFDADLASRVVEAIRPQRAAPQDLRLRRTWEARPG
jgi:hypothetical protein